MAILVCPLSQVASVAAARRPGRLVSLLDPDSRFPNGAALGVAHHHIAKVHDIAAPLEGYNAPSAAQVEALIGFLAPWDREAPLLVHCWAGISRSTATAFIAACLHNPSADEGEIAQTLRRASATATPNPLLVALADAELGRGGRMVRAVAAITRGGPWVDVLEARPFEIPSRYPDTGT